MWPDGNLSPGSAANRGLSLTLPASNTDQPVGLAATTLGKPYTAYLAGLGIEPWNRPSFLSIMVP